MQLDRANHPGFGVVARLRDGVTFDAANRELMAIAASLSREYPASNRDMGVRMQPMLDSITGTIRPTLLMLACSVIVLLLIACANVANLLLAKGLQRERETSILAALGASRLRLVRLFLIEGLILGTAGSAAGLLLAGWGVRLLHSVPGLTIPRTADVAIDPHVLAFALGLGFATALLFALAPALQLSRVDLMAVLRLAAGGDGSNQRTARLRSALVAAEVALLIVLLAGAALMQRTLQKLSAEDAGFAADRIIAVPMVQMRGRYGDPAIATRFADSLIASLQANPSVAAAAVAWPFDYTGFSWSPNINLPDHPFEPGREPPVQAASVTPGYFQAMGIRIVRGRGFGTGDRSGGPVAVIVNETFAARFFPGEDPIGRRVEALKIPAMAAMAIVGVVNDTRRAGMLVGFPPEIYVPFAQFPQSGATAVVRAAGGDPLALAGDVKTRIAALDPGIAVSTVRRVSDVLVQSYGDRRALSWLLSVFAALALGLTVLGIASVVAFTVARRTGEIGIRIALGANPGGVVRFIVAQAMIPVAIGGGIGAAALVPVSRSLRAYLFGVSAADPVALGAAVAVLLASATVAAYVPARRATSVDPLRALRAS